MFDFAGLELTPHAGIIGLLHYIVIKAAAASTSRSHRCFISPNSAT